MPLLFFDIFRISFVYLKILGLLILWKCIKIHQMWVLNNQFYFNLSAFRGHQARKTYKPVIEKRHEAAVKIQSVVRGLRTRQELKQKRIEEEKVAMLLQEGKLLRTEKKKENMFYLYLYYTIRLHTAISVFFVGRVTLKLCQASCDISSNLCNICCDVALLSEILCKIRSTNSQITVPVITVHSTRCTVCPPSASWRLWVTITDHSTFRMASLLGYWTRNWKSCENWSNKG